MGFIRINNRSNFLIKSLEVYHPETRAYIDYWRMHKKRCIEGFWSIDDSDIQIDVNKPTPIIESNKWRYMPEKLYFYINFGTILHKPEDSPKTAPKQKMRPLLRDVEWEFFYNITEARGFSGFEDDDEYTCNNSVFLQEEQLHSSCINPHTKEPKIYLKPYDYLRKLHNKPQGKALWENQAKNLFVLGSRGFGKDLHEDTPIYSVKRGKIPIKDVEIDEYIYGADGKPTKVIDRFDFNNQKQYKITLADGREVISGEGHLWKVIDNYGKESVVETRYIRDNYKAYQRKKHNGKYDFDSKFFIPMNEAIDSPEIDLSINPYYLGLWLGDGSSTSSAITTIDEEIKDFVYQYCKEFKDHFVSINQNTNKTCPTYKISSGNTSVKNILLNHIKDLNLIKNKHIPEIYFNASKEQRLELLKGLMDSDGYIAKSGLSCEFSSSIETLAFDVLRLARSLGIRAEISSRYPTYKLNGETKTGKLSYRITLKPKINIFKLSRKANLFTGDLGRYSNSTRNKVAIKNVEEIGVLPSVCIAVDNQDKLFLAGEYVVTHNSFSLGVGLVLHELLFDGARYYTQESIDNPFKVEVLVGAAMASKSSDLLAKTLDAYNSLPGAFGSDNEYVPSPFFKQFTGSLGPNNTKNPWKHEYEKKIGSQWVTQGSGSNLKHAIFTIENPEAAAGTRPGIILVEETGLLPNLLTVHGSNTATQMEGNTKFGSSFYIGTGGNMEKIVESQVIFYDPEGFDFVAFDNEYEEDNRKIGFFVPAYYALNQYKDDNGNTNVEAAKSYLLKVREKKKRSKDSSALDLEMMNYPIVPSEMFLNKKGNIFPTALLRDRQVEIETDTKYENALYIGKLKINSDTAKVEWLLDPNVRYIKKFPLTKDDEVNKEGGLVIYNHPITDEQGDILYGRYIAGCDPYDHDDAGTGSLGATLVYDRFTNQIVAEYTGRPQTAREYYENVRKLLIYYNAKLLYENERKGIYDYFESKHSVYLLQEQPEIIKDVLQNSKVNRSYGMHMNNALKRYGEELIKTWLLSPHDDGDSEILNSHKLRCLPLIQELVSYNPQGNYDRVMAFMMLMYFIQETRKIELDATKVSSNNSIASSSFFSRSLFQKTKRL